MTPEQRSLRDALAAVPDRLAAAIPRAARAPAGEWTPEQVIRHLLAVDDEVWQPRLHQLETEPEPHWPWYEPGLSAATADGWAAVLDLFRASRARTVAQLDGLDDAGWAKVGVHERYGRLDVAALMQKALDHDEEHVASFGG
jgi:hypothetical protein